MGLLNLPTEATRAVEPRVPQRAVTGDLGEPMRNRLMASAGGLAGDRRRLVTILVERREEMRATVEARKNWCEVIRGEVCVMGGVAGLIAYLVYGW